MAQKKSKRTEIAQKLQQDIYLKGLLPGDFIGSVRRLAMRYQTTPLTISRMLNEMVIAGELSKDDNGFHRVLKNPLAKPHIGYAGEPLLPSGTLDYLMQDAVRKLFNELDKLGTPPQIIGYHELRDPEIAQQRLKKINGLILHDSFVDSRTLEVLNNLTIPIVRVGETFPKYLTLSTSEVVQFFEPALNEFARFCDLKSYRRIIIIYIRHWNGIQLARKIKNFLHGKKLSDKVEMLAFPQGDSMGMLAFYHFQPLQNIDWSDTLIISTSGYSSRGICRAFASADRMPDILSIDNLDKFDKNYPFGEPFLTAIDRNMDRIFRDAAKLIYEQVESGDERKIIIQVPAKLVIRKSIRHINPNWQEKTL
ncbi:MAG: hypothetical protein IKD10_06170 [Lentisphaeria bacterium]|nr:hypothetical protein [Lentisphaeria bacterium]